MMLNSAYETVKRTNPASEVGGEAECQGLKPASCRRPLAEATRATPVTGSCQLSLPLENMVRHDDGQKNSTQPT
jgi:hypothetical protein